MKVNKTQTIDFDIIVDTTKLEELKNLTDSILKNVDEINKSTINVTIPKISLVSIKEFRIVDEGITPDPLLNALKDGYEIIEIYNMLPIQVGNTSYKPYTKYILGKYEVQ